MNGHTATEPPKATPAVGAQVDRVVRPCAWLREQRGDYEGAATLAPLFVLGDVGVKPNSALLGATYEPLYSQDDLDAAVAAEREWLALLAEANEDSAGFHSLSAAEIRARRIVA